MNDYSDTAISTAVRDAHAYVQRGQFNEAIHALQGSLQQVAADAQDYAQGVVALRKAYTKKGDARGALSCSWYLQEDVTLSPWLRLVPALDKARAYDCAAKRAASESTTSASLFTTAASHFEDAGWLAHGAYAAECGQQHERARTLYTRLVHQFQAARDTNLYAAALANFNLARMSHKLRDERTALDATVAAVHLLEEAADRFEAMGQRERAFDCFQVLVAMGRESASTENALEGYVNIIRILREDQLKAYALQTFDDAIAFVASRNEVSAAATLAKEMAVYAEAEGLPERLANFATLKQAQLWKELALQTMGRGGPPEIAENALLAAVAAYAELGQFAKAGDVYLELSRLPIEESRKAHYDKAAQRYRGLSDERLIAEELPQGWKRDSALASVWIINLLEWERQGSAAEACAEILVSSENYPDTTRRRALLARLRALQWEASGHNPQTALELIGALEPLELYDVISPLERFLEDGTAELRRAAVGALGRFLFKRSFLSLRRAISDPHPDVVRAACASIRVLHFPHAFNPLARILRESPHDEEGRIAALQSLARIDSPEAADFVYNVFANAGPNERKQLEPALRKSAGERFIQLAMSRYRDEGSELKQALERVLRARGVRV